MQRRLAKRVGAIGALVCAGIASAGGSGTFVLERSTIDGGGGLQTGPAFSLSGTVAQADADNRMTGDYFTLQGGFWPDASAVGCNAADVAFQFGILDLTDINVFVGAFVTQGPLGDLNDDGVFDLGDINAFIQAFTSGCP